MNDIIEGERFIDLRGVVEYFNAFNMRGIVRMYKIQPSKGVIRAWQGHKLEQKWFYPISGCMEVKVARVNDWSNPQTIHSVSKYQLEAGKPQILHIPGGTINGFRALEENSVMIVFSDFTIEGSHNDVIRIGLDEIPWDSL